jgi:hypothetical protein
MCAHVWTQPYGSSCSSSLSVLRSCEHLHVGAPLTHLPCCAASQAARDIADTMSKSRNIVYLPSQGNMLMSINPN